MIAHDLTSRQITRKRFELPSNQVIQVVDAQTQQSAESFLLSPFGKIAIGLAFAVAMVALAHIGTILALAAFFVVTAQTHRTSHWYDWFAQGAIVLPITGALHTAPLIGAALAVGWLAWPILRARLLKIAVLSSRKQTILIAGLCTLVVFTGGFLSIVVLFDLLMVYAVVAQRAQSWHWLWYWAPVILMAVLIHSMPVLGAIVLFFWLKRIGTIRSVVLTVVAFFMPGIAITLRDR